ncbi:MAG TPA: hypothetical protein VES65_01250 [Solirubrobacteraceae bacterium]|nr:hypothetical protein [Solirubrobacteraceae bacterium]
MGDPLAGVRAKLDRAEEHLDTLKDQVSTFLDTDPYGVRQHIHPETGGYSLSIEIRQQPPLLINVIVGDLIHNLRSALDHLAWQLVLANGRKPSGSTQFPIFVREPVADDDIGKWKARVKGMSPEVVKEIASIQPYAADGEARLHSLAILNAFSNEDKHKLPLACVAAIAKHEPGTAGVAPVRDVEIESMDIATGKPLKDGDYIAWGKVRITGPNPQTEVKGKLPVEIAFGDRHARLDGLVDLCHQVGSVVALMELTAWPHRTPPVG